MAKVRYKIKGNKVIGSNKKDKIFWQSSSSWQKPLIVHGNGGNDKIVFLKSPFNKNKLYGDAGKDTIIGSMRNDFIWGGAGNDILTGNSGNDQIHCGAGWDLADGGSGKDKIWCDSGANAVSGGSKNDTIYGGTGFDAIAGGSGNDVIELKAFSDSAKTITFTLDKNLSKAFGGKKTIILTEKTRSVVFGGSGNDKISNIQGGAIIDGGDGADTITAISGNNTIYGGGGEDKITGGTGNDYIDGGARSDTIDGGAGNDTIYGGANADNLKGGAGNDYIDGGANNDTIDGGDGDDILKGGTSEDLIYGGNGDDSIYGGTGSDTIKAGKGYNKIYFNNGDGSDVIYSDGGDDTLVFLDDTFLSKGTYNSDGDLVLKGIIKLKNYANLQDNHSVKYVMFGNDSTVHNISEYVPVLNSAPSLMSTPNRNDLVAEVAAWQNNDNNGYADVADITAAQEQDIIVAVANSYTNNQTF